MVTSGPTMSPPACCRLAPLLPRPAAAARFHARSRRLVRSRRDGEPPRWASMQPASGYGVGSELLQIQKDPGGAFHATRFWKSTRPQSQIHQPRLARRLYLRPRRRSHGLPRCLKRRAEMEGWPLWPRTGNPGEGCAAGRRRIGGGRSVGPQPAGSPGVGALFRSPGQDLEPAGARRRVFGGAKR